MLLRIKKQISMEALPHFAVEASYCNGDCFS